MSSRLIILPKKTWHVWNREAIAKVRNDEKKHQEETQAAEEKERRAIQESRFNTLKSRANAQVDPAIDAPSTFSQVEHVLMSTSISMPSSSAVAIRQPSQQQEHINFFSDIEFALGGNQEHLKEKYEKEMKEAKRSGYAPAALGGTKEEREKEAPWWGAFALKGAPELPLAPQVQPMSSESISTTKRRGTVERCALPSEDPMFKLLKPVSSSSATSLLVVGSEPLENVCSSTKKKEVKGKKLKKDKKEKKNKEKKKHKNGERRKRRHSSSDSSSDEHEDEKRARRRARADDNNSNEIEKSGASKVASTMMATSGPSLWELRQRRLEREGGERARAAVVLARARPEDEEAAFLTSQSQKKYHNQFYPNRK
jgi:hypothetical protein